MVQLTMSILRNQLVIGNKVVSLISNPITEMICAFIIDQSKHALLALIHQFTGDQLIYSILLILFLLTPWIMLGHGAFRYENSKFKGVAYTPLGNFSSSDALMSKKRLKLVSFLFAIFVFLQFFNL